MSVNGSFTPRWFEGKLPERSYRSAFKWGAPDGFKHPNPRLYTLMKETFGLDDTYFEAPHSLGLEEVCRVLQRAAVAALCPDHSNGEVEFCGALDGPCD